MKSYYFKNILNQILKSKKESMIIFSITFVFSFFLSQIYFFGYNPVIENNIANYLNLSQEISNYHIFDDNFRESREGIKDYNLLFHDVITLIDEIGHHPNVESYDYNLILYRQYSLKGTKKNETMYHNWYGINQEDYVSKNRIELIDGRKMTQQEIEKGSPVVIVADDMQVMDENEEKRTVQVGDVLSFYDDVRDPEGVEAIDLEVIGVYKREYKHFQTYGVNDRFVNSGGVLVSNQLILNLLNHSSTFNYKNARINRIAFYTKDYRKEFEFKNFLTHKLNEFEETSREKYGDKISFKLMPSKNSSIIASVVQIKSVYQIVFFVVVSVIVVLYISIIHYLMKKKTQEIKIYFTLGQTKRKIIFQYIVYYFIVGSIATLLALIMGYFISQSLLSSMIADKIAFQNDILRFSEGYYWQITNEQLLAPDYQFTLISSLKIILEVIAIIVASVLYSGFTIFRQMR